MTTFKSCIMGAFMVGALALPTQAQTAIKIGCLISTDCAPISVALQEGLFAKHGLDASAEIIAYNALVPAGLMSDSLQVGALSSTVFMQAADGGLPLVTISGGTSLTGELADGFGVVVKPGSGLSAPADFSRKTVAVPSINATLHVLFQHWLLEGGVDLASVSFVEVPFANIGDSIAAGSVDAGVVSEPMVSLITGNGLGEYGANITEGVPSGTPSVLYATTRAWAEANPEAVAGFRAALAEAAEIVIANPDLARVAHSKLAGTPLEVLKRVNLARPDLEITAERLDWWVATMKAQNLVNTDVNTGDLILP